MKDWHANFRKKFLINPRFQIIFMIFMGGISFIAVAIFYCANLSFFWKFQKMGIDLGLPAGSPFFRYLNQQQSLMRQVALITSVILCVVIFIVGLLFSHRICGPLYRVEKHMRSIGAGEKMTPLKFRKGDFFPEIASAFNSMVPPESKKSPRRPKTPKPMV